MLANTGVALDDSLATRSSLLSTLLRSPAALGVLDGDRAYRRRSRSARTEARSRSATGRGTVILFDTETREQIGDHQLPGEPWSGSPSTPGATRSRSPRAPTLEHPKGPCRSSTRALCGCKAPSRSAPIRPPPGRTTSPPPSTPRTGEAWSVSYSTGDFDYSVPVFLRRFDARTGSPLGPAVRVAPKSSKIPLISTADGRLLVSTATGGPGDAHLRDRRGDAARPGPLSGERFQHRHQPRRAHARVRASTARRSAPSPARPRLRAGADARLRPRGMSGSGPSAPTGEPCRPGTTTGT